MTRDEVLAEFGIDQIRRPAEAEDVADRMADEIVRLRKALKHETQWADAGIDSAGFWQQQRDEIASELSISRLANEEISKRLAAVEFANTKVTQRAEKAERILDALLEPSTAVVDAANVWLPEYSRTRAAIHAAVAAAEKEAERGDL